MDVVQHSEQSRIGSVQTEKGGKTMPDREKVIKELTCCIYSEEECECPEDCPYVDDDMSECQAKVMRDALALLKEQQEKIEYLEHQLETLTRWRANAGAFD